MSKLPTNVTQLNPQDADHDPSAVSNITPFSLNRDAKPAVEADSTGMPDPRDPESDRMPPVPPPMNDPQQGHGPGPSPRKPRKPRKSATNGSTPPNGSENLAEPVVPIAKPAPPNGAENLTEPSAPIAKPTAGSSLDKFKSKHAGTIANVGTVPSALPHHSVSDAKDFVRLHPDKENYWSPELCFVSVPIPGVKNPVLHLITEELAEKYLSGGKVKRFRLALASKPLNHFFLCQVPSRNLDNSWNQSNLEGCERATTQWISLTSRKETEGIESYKLDFARDQDAFPDPAWPARTIEELIETAFAGRMIDRDDHPALLRLIGAKQKTS